MLRGPWEKVWDVVCGRELRSYMEQTKAPVGEARSPDGKQVAEACEDDEVISNVLDAISWQIIGKARGGGTEIVKVRDAATGRLLHILRGHTEAVLGVPYSPDGRRLVSCGQGGTVRVWDARTGQELLCLKGHSGWVTCVAYSPDGNRLASGGQDQTVRVWEAQAGQGPE